MKEISVKALSLNPFTAFGDDWMALSAGTEETGFNAMTVAWGNFGTLLGTWQPCEPAAHGGLLCSSQPIHQGFLDREPYFALSHLAAASNKRSGILAATRPEWG